MNRDYRNDRGRNDIARNDRDRNDSEKNDGARNDIVRNDRPRNDSSRNCSDNRNNRKKRSWLAVIILSVITVLLAAGVVVAVIANNKQNKNYAEQASGGPHLGPSIQVTGSGTVVSPDMEQENEEAEQESTEPEKQILHFVDAHDNWYDVEIDPGVEKHPYDLSKMSNDQTICTYEDETYTSRRGIDVSAYQGGIDWISVAGSGIEFAFVRTGYRGYGAEGTLVSDDLAPANILGAQEAGLDVGVYFFSQAINEEEAVEEADFVLSMIQPYELQLPVVFDSENILDDDARTDNVSGEQFTKNAVAFCERIKAAGYDAAIYSNMKWEAFTYDLKELSDYPIWYADYELLPQTPYRFTWWQYSEKGYVPGVEGEVDLDIEILRK